MTDLAALYDACAATWPAAACQPSGGFIVREGGGGGRRVSAATAEPDWTDTDISTAETAMAALGQSSLFMIRAGDERLDAALDARGYAIADPTVLYAAPISALGPAPDPMAAFAHWPPLAITEAIWSQHDIGPARLAIMQRAADPRAAILGRSRDRPAGAAFVAVRKTIAVLHAVVVPVALRRQGCGANLVRRAADWAGEQGADRLVLAVTTTNHGARALYASLGMEAVGHYHYRMK